MNDNIYIHLLDLGLSDTEIRIYTYLIGMPAQTIAEIHKSLKIPRTTTVENILKLVDKGLVLRTFSKKSWRYIVRDIDDLVHLIDSQRTQLEGSIRRLEQINNLLPQIASSLIRDRAERNSQLEIFYYEGKSQVRRFYFSTLKANEVYSFVDLEMFYRIFPHGLSLQNKSFGKRLHRFVYDIVLDSEFSRNKITQKISSREFASYKVKFLPNSSSFREYISGDLIVFNDSVGIISLSSPKVSCIEIRSSLIAGNFRALHRSLWELL